MSLLDKTNKCKRMNKCNAPLCPLDKECLKHCIWYPDEEICPWSKADEEDKKWIKRQRKIAKKVIDRQTYYTLEMLKKSIRITKTLEGLDPAKDKKAELEKWHKRHKGMKPLSEEQKKQLFERMRRVKREF